ncbi:MAG: TIGR04552 family protein, partial [Deltaproteobacteria bacterium]|nr:TIGR04552 family protein [Deltaproteobacteria bacterium]
FDYNAVKLTLSNENILEWTALDVSEDEAVNICDTHSLNLDLASDLDMIERIRDEAIVYLKEEFKFPIPAPLQKASLPELLQFAGKLSSRHRQLGACTLLKAMHVINHFDAGEARSALKVTDQELFKDAENRIYRVISSMMAKGLPVVEFMGGRKQRASMVTKLLSKDDPLAAQLFDKMRFRIVTATKEDIIPTINYLTKKLFPFNYILSGETYNTILPIHNYMVKGNDIETINPGTIYDIPASRDSSTGLPVWNQHSSPKYRVIHWVADMPVRIRDYENAYITDGINPVPRPVIYIRTEFQILDRHTNRQNESGEASHKKYKYRQVDSVLKKLKVKRPKEETAEKTL